MEKEIKTHRLKTWSKYFWEVVEGNKTFELRKNDRDFKVGDNLLLEDYDEKKQIYSFNTLLVKITYMLDGGNFGLEEGYVILGIKKI
jgi:hypothetical protein